MRDRVLSSAEVPRPADADPGEEGRQLQRLGDQRATHGAVVRRRRFSDAATTTAAMPYASLKRIGFIINNQLKESVLPTIDIGPQRSNTGHLPIPIWQATKARGPSDGNGAGYVQKLANKLLMMIMTKNLT